MQIKIDFPININKFLVENQGEIIINNIKPVVLRQDIKVYISYSSSKSDKYYIVKKVFPEQWNDFNNVHKDDIVLIEPFTMSQRQKYGFFILLRKTIDINKKNIVESELVNNIASTEDNKFLLQSEQKTIEQPKEDSYKDKIFEEQPKEELLIEEDDSDRQDGKKKKKR